MRPFSLRSQFAAVGCLMLLDVLVTTTFAGDALVVHEWGTFTALQDERGDELSGINTDDEPVPPFVHNLNPFLLSKPLLSSIHWQYRQKAAPRVHPRITMRLETPVIYFYPPERWELPRSVDVSVSFRGGWLTEFYPRAKPQAPGLKEGLFDFGKLTSDTMSSLSWQSVQVGGNGTGPTTQEPVWLTPRQVHAANLSVGNESERYLFYRGVGRIRAPLRAVLNRDRGELALHGNFDQILNGDESATLGGLWLVSVRSDGRLAYRSLGSHEVSSDSDAKLTATSYRFEDREYQPGQRDELEREMHAALVGDGLFEDEATAMLNTWQKSYFQSPGLRLFYLVPRGWTDHHLPLNIAASEVSERVLIERVMIGRLELISDEQRALLDRLAKLAPSNGRWVDDIPEGAAREKFLAGRTDFGDLGVAIPPDYQLYLALGRFRNALVAHAERTCPTTNISTFMDTYQLHPFRINDLASSEQGKD